jgi:hypothetical protein
MEPLPSFDDIHRKHGKSYVASLDASSHHSLGLNTAGVRMAASYVVRYGKEAHPVWKADAVARIRAKSQGRLYFPKISSFSTPVKRFYDSPGENSAAKGRRLKC